MTFETLSTGSFREWRYFGDSDNLEAKTQKTKIMNIINIGIRCHLSAFPKKLGNIRIVPKIVANVVAVEMPCAVNCRFMDLRES